jgi:hypothetical protein
MKLRITYTDITYYAVHFEVMISDDLDLLTIVTPGVAAARAT